MINRLLHVLSFASASLALLSEVRAAPNSDRTPVEHVVKVPRRMTPGLGTVEYRPSDRERPFFARLDPAERKIGGTAGDYDIAAKNGKYVGWFGIVRGVSEDSAAGRTTLLIEHKYFDGLTDAHIQAVSFNGSGDFRAVLGGVDRGIGRLSLVRVYGKVTAASGQLPQVEAVFVRNWHWRTFTFIAAWGTQRDSQQWRKLNRVALKDIYCPDPDVGYYEARLGRRTADDPLYRRLLRPAGKLTPEGERLMVDLIDRLQRAKDLFGVYPILSRIRASHAEAAAIAVLLTVMQDEEVPLWAVPNVLGSIAGPREVPALVALMRHANADVRSRAIETLFQMGNVAAPAVPNLVKALRDVDPGVRQWAAHALQRIGARGEVVVGPLRECLKDPDGGMRIAAAETLWRLTFQPQPTLSVLIAALSDADEDVRSSAAEALGNMAAEAEAAGPALIQALKDKEQSVRYAAAQALGAVRPEPKKTLPALATALKDQDRFVGSQAAGAIGRYGAAAESAVPALVAALRDEDDSMRWYAASALGDIGPAAAKAITALTDALQHDRDDQVRWAAAGAMGSIDREGRVVIPALTQALTQKSAQVRRFAAIALGQIGPGAKAALPALRTAVKEKDGGVRIAAAEALWTVGGDGKAAMPVLLEGLRTSPYPHLAAHALGTMGPMAAVATPALVDLLGRQRGYEREDAITALGNIGPGAAAAVPFLLDLVRRSNEDRGSALAAAESLWKINRDPHALPFLIEQLSSNDCLVGAAEALGRLGPAAREAIPALRQAAGNLDPAIRKAAAEALVKIKRQKR
jgi:HEAT repeat protein